MECPLTWTPTWQEYLVIMTGNTVNHITLHVCCHTMTNLGLTIDTYKHRHGQLFIQLPRTAWSGIIKGTVQWQLSGVKSRNYRLVSLDWLATGYSFKNVKDLQLQLLNSKKTGFSSLKGSSVRFYYLWLFSSIDPVGARVSFTSFSSNSVPNS